jgi:NADPH:quinone reductase-like Zn-dependent oxidoreductase
MIARKPATLTDIEAAALPVVASTAWQMVFDHARITAGQRLLVLGAAGSVGAYALQLASFAGAHVTAAARASQRDYVRSLGAAEVIDAEADPFEGGECSFGVVLDTIGGGMLQRSFARLRRGGIIVSVAAQPDPAEAASVPSSFWSMSARQASTVSRP